MSFARSMGQCIHTKTHNNEKTGEWHPHVHMFALLDTWIDQEHLSETWHEITGDSFIVDIRRVKKKINNMAIQMQRLRFVSTL